MEEILKQYFENDSELNIIQIKTEHSQNIDFQGGLNQQLNDINGYINQSAAMNSQAYIKNQP